MNRLLTYFKSRWQLAAQISACTPAGPQDDDDTA